MKLQLALDDLSLDDSLALIDKLKNYIDIVEIGTPLIMKEGMKPVREVKSRFPKLEILADLKIMDAGYYEAEIAFEAGADYATVLGVTDLLTIKGCVEAANKYGKKAVVDMICVENLPERIKQVEDLGVHILSVHTGADQQAAGREPIEDLEVMSAHVSNASISVAGGINSKTVKKYAALKPSIIIVGSGITHNADPVAEAAAIASVLKGE